MEFQMDDAIGILSRTPETLNRLLRDLPESWVQANEGAGYLERIRYPRTFILNGRPLRSQKAAVLIVID